MISPLRRLVPARPDPPGRSPAFSDRVVARAGAALTPHTFHRRGFLWRVTLAGTALAINPFDFVLKPGTAYASVCGRAASCSSGWTAFCCTIHGGANVCPPGSFAAGWWRVDDSAFCRGAARYIIDCNRRPRASCRCRCASGTCDRRRVCCNRFRYGQCNQHIGGVTEVVCRVVTCTPPWRWDPSCTRTVRVDNRTATHSAPCLPRAWPTHIEIKYQDLGLVGSVLGAPTSRERDAAGGGQIRHYERGMILHKRGIGARAVYGAIATAYARNGLEQGPLGYPTTDRQRLPDGRGRRNRFERGFILWTRATGARAVYGVFRTVYRREGMHGGPLGYPVEERRSNGDGRGRRQRFERGVILRTQATGTHAIYARFYDLFRDFGGTGGALGYPTGRQRNVGDGRGRFQRFEGGAIYHTRQTRTRVVYGAFHETYERRRGPQGPLRYPTTGQRNVGDGRGRFQRFERGAIYRTAETGVQAVHGPIHRRYLDRGGPTGPLGYPVTSVETDSGGVRRVTFENGTITHDPATGRTVDRLA